MEENADSLLNSIKGVLKNQPYDKPYAKNSSMVDENNFNEIKIAESGSQLVFIDGGNAEIFSTANFSLQLIRGAYVIYQNNKKIGFGKTEFFALIFCSKKGSKMGYEAKIFQFKKDSIIPSAGDLAFDSYDESLVNEDSRKNIAKIADFIRKITEIEIAKKKNDDLNKGDIIIFDGDLQMKTKNEIHSLDVLFSKALGKGIIISALSKTSSMLTEKGNSLPYYLNSIGKNKCWSYNISEDNRVFLCFVKLNVHSQYTFKFEIFCNQKDEINRILSVLVKNSVDPVFLGYPYGLLEADKHARVSNQEKEYLQTKIMANLGKDAEKLIKSANSINAHKIFDTIH